MLRMFRKSTDLSPEDDIEPNTTSMVQIDTKALDYISNPVMVANAALEVVYANQSSIDMLRTVEAEMRKQVPDFRAEDIVGKPIDKFHTNPAHQRTILRDLTRPYDGAIQLGKHFLRFRASPKLGPDRELSAIYVEWFDETELKKSRDQVEELMTRVHDMARAHEDGYISEFIDITVLEGRYAEVATRINTMVQGHIATKKKIVACAEAFSHGDFDHELERFSGDRGFLNDAMDSIRASFHHVVGEIDSMTNDITNGRLSRRIDVDGFEGDFRRIAVSFDGTFSYLRETISDIMMQISQMNDAIRMISESTNQMAERTTREAATLEEMAASTSTVSSATRTNKVAIGQLSISADHASQSGATGINTASDMLKAIEMTLNTSERIASVVTEIQDIATKTNLLALNASVEAARAGEHGKGFAVVAQEVRNLATQSAKAAQKTTELVGETRGGIGASSEGARNTFGAFTTISDAVREISSQIKKVEGATIEQAGNLEVLDAGMKDMAQNSTSAASMADSIAAATDQLHAATQSVYDRLAAFEVSDHA